MSARTSRARDFGHVGVLMGGQSAEREVSLNSGTMVLDALRARGVDAVAFDTGHRGLGELAAAGFDRVFIALHGRGGEDGTIQGALELMRLPYTGSGVLASALAMDKVASKRIFETHGLPTPAWKALSLEKADRRALMDLPDALGLPLIVKPPHEGSTIGISKVDGYSQMNQATQLAGRYDDIVLFERFVVGDELTCAVIERAGVPVALPVIHIVAPDGNYDYEHKYLTDDTRYLCPAGLGDALEQQVRDLALRAFDALGCSGWGRVDFMLARGGEDDGVPFVLEVNTAPGMTDHSLVPMAGRAAGLEYADLVLEILATARLHGRVGDTPDHKGAAHVE